MPFCFWGPELSLQLLTAVKDKSNLSKNIFQIADTVTIILKLTENKYRKEEGREVRMKGHWNYSTKLQLQQT
jgi:hypothetical protein